tara:strand:- start:3111 stop:4880 length:1770 start_codon:yes stop_codon:yes gene_type:complete
MLYLNLNKFYFLRVLSFYLLTILSLNLIANTNPTVEEIRELEELKIGQSIVKEDNKFLEIQTSVRKADDDASVCTDCIYGYDLFSEIPTTFALSSNNPIPQDYILGPGDKLKVEYFGSNDDLYEGFIARSGLFKLPQLGPLNLAGLSFSKAEELIKTKVESELIGTDVFLSLSELKSINVYVVGAAYKPGTYTISALSSLTNVVFSSGGPNKVGSLRNIQVKRKGNLLVNFDFYDLLLNGDTSKDIRLQDGDTVFYPLINSSIRIDGAVQRPGKFEIKDGEKLSRAFEFAGFKNKYDQKIQFSRFLPSSGDRRVEILENNSETRSKTLQDGDSINILSNSNQSVANVYLAGEFLYPGYYDVSSGEKISDIIAKAGGFTKSAYPEGAVFTRESVKKLQKDSYLKTAISLEKALVDAVSSGNQIDGAAYNAISRFIENLKDQEPIGRQVVSVDSYSLKSDPGFNFSLQNGDELFIPEKSPSVSVVGEVLNSTTHIYRETYTVQDYIDLSGGTTDGADLSKIFVILPNGQAEIYKRKLFQDDIDDLLLPGSTIVVSRNPDPYNWFKLASVITPVLSDLAVSAAAIAAISNNN